jgi:CHAD domain-containing protein
MTRTEHAVARTRDPKLDGDQSFGAAMAQLIGRRWEQVWSELDRIGQASDADAIHDIRVASRRLRAAMDVAADCFPPEWYSPLHRTAKAITAAFGEVRDRDVVLHALAKERAAASAEDYPALDRLIAQAERERKAARREMREFLAVLESSGARRASREQFAAAAGAAGKQQHR